MRRDDNLTGTGSCRQCGNDCIKCDNDQTCTVCKTGFYSDSGKCKQCKSNCDACNSTHCLDCAPEHCPLSDDSCGPCATVCSECTGPSDKECIECDPGYYFSRLNRNCFKCNEAGSACTGPNANDCSNCSSGYCMNKGKCTKCESGCRACEDYRKCTSCQNGFYLVNDNGDHDCEPCPDDGRMDCDNEKHECKACFPGYYESRSTSGILICKKCKQNDCKECKTAGSQSQTTCNTCFDGFYLENNECSKCEFPCSLCSSKEVCTKMWQWNLSNKCDSSCKACFGAQQFHCSSCHDGFYLNESNYCIDCDSSCATCSGTATTSCR